jgi:hypothetical protein
MEPKNEMDIDAEIKRLEDDCEGNAEIYNVARRQFIAWLKELKALRVSSCPIISRLESYTVPSSRGMEIRLAKAVAEAEIWNEKWSEENLKVFCLRGLVDRMHDWMNSVIAEGLVGGEGYLWEFGKIEREMEKLGIEVKNTLAKD